jgi:putative addiction module component (TIGR02574 family)
MSQTVAELLDAALALSEDERAELVGRLAESLDPPPSSLHPAWKAEISRRAAEVDSGQVKPIPWAEIRREMEAELDAGADGG